MTKNSFDSLLAAVNNRKESGGPDALAEMALATEPLMAWLGYLSNIDEYTHAKPFLLGVQAAAIETATCVALGLVRPAIMAMRTQYELLLAWSYFCDHTVECERLLKKNEGFQFPSSVKKYLLKNFEKFEERFKLLIKHRDRKLEDPYDLLSSHVHATSEMALPTYGDITSVIATSDVCEEIVDIQREVTEYLSDLLLARFASDWVGLPEAVQEFAKPRLNPKQLKELCS